MKKFGISFVFDRRTMQIFFMEGFVLVSRALLQDPWVFSLAKYYIMVSSIFSSMRCAFWGWFSNHKISSYNVTAKYKHTLTTRSEFFKILMMFFLSSSILFELLIRVQGQCLWDQINSSRCILCIVEVPIPNHDPITQSLWYCDIDHIGTPFQSC